MKIRSNIGSRSWSMSESGSGPRLDSPPADGPRAGPRFRSRSWSMSVSVSVSWFGSQFQSWYWSWSWSSFFGMRRGLGMSLRFLGNFK
jgi:hypothetical protein